MQSPSADNEVFSTPPSTPSAFLDRKAAASLDPLLPSLSRKPNSRPSNLHIAQFNPDVVLDQNSPGTARSPPSQAESRDVDSVPSSAASSASDSPVYLPNIINSPCFVHSNLDKGASFADWIRGKQGPHSFDLGVSKSLQSPMIEHSSLAHHRHDARSGEYVDDCDDDDDSTSASLTKQLAETAVGVREMSKQLGRARIRSNIQNVLIVTKARDNRLIKLTRELALYLMLRRSNGGRGLVVYVDHQLRTSRRFDAVGIERDHPELFVPFPRRRSSSSTSLASVSTLSSDANGHVTPVEEGQLRYWTADMCSRSPHLFDFVVTLGGDGTVLFTSWLFQRIVPPVLSFALGSLGFLTNFDFADHKQVMDSVVDNGIRVNLRMRFTCTVYRAVRGPEGTSKRKAVKKGDTGEIMMRNIEKGGWEALEGGGLHEHRAAKDKEIMCFTTRPAESFEVINDVVIDRGPSPYVSMLELFGDDHHMTTVQGDGLTISTPTGSTAYSLSAGGSLVHPEIPAILITPIAPHTLSFRPMLLPDSIEVRVCVPFNSRSTAWVSFDGRGRVELKRGDHIKVTASKYPFPTVCHDKQSTDWFHSISRTLKWNERERQKSFVVVEEGPEKKSKNAPAGSVDDSAAESSDEEDEQEETFDIDDISPDSVAPTAETTVVSVVRSSPNTLETAREKAQERHAEDLAAHRAAEALLKGQLPGSFGPRSGLSSGVDSPSRYIAGGPPHLPIPTHHNPPHLPRHVQFTSPPLPAHSHPHPHPHNPHRDDARTPTAVEHRRTGRSRSRQRADVAPVIAPRAFAVYGHDESDSAPSDSDQ
ncbi:ATP-NAD kinase-like domain-containing protein [Vararia minispora EC-137]|uniref:ATP-NAD kinase-like domain-containing protein n=1 Tax=Vararia minispora EC-137 TaxID=1314806 RepID=A0ACB8QZ54_9AGAM|nr:ATP-NAD kinase-like domain-containing protein [Vararia minispora EC-137]